MHSQSTCVNLKAGESKDVFLLDDGSALVSATVMGGDGKKGDAFDYFDVQCTQDEKCRKVVRFTAIVDICALLFVVEDVIVDWPKFIAYKPSLPPKPGAVAPEPETSLEANPDDAGSVTVGDTVVAFDYLGNDNNPDGTGPAEAETIDGMAVVVGTLINTADGFAITPNADGTIDIDTTGVAPGTYQIPYTPTDAEDDDAMSFITIEVVALPCPVATLTPTANKAATSFSVEVAIADESGVITACYEDAGGNDVTDQFPATTGVADGDTIAVSLLSFFQNTQLQNVRMFLKSDDPACGEIGSVVLDSKLVAPEGDVRFVNVVDDGASGMTADAQVNGITIGRVDVSGPGLDATSAIDVNQVRSVATSDGATTEINFVCPYNFRETLVDLDGIGDSIDYITTTTGEGVNQSLTSLTSNPNHEFTGDGTDTTIITTADTTNENEGPGVRIDGGPVTSITNVHRADDGDGGPGSGTVFIAFRYEVICP